MLSYDGPVWRILREDQVNAPAQPARALEGRFHHSGQTAAYTSLSAEGARIAIQRYLEDGAPRQLAPMWLEAEYVVDHSGDRAASIVWQDLRATGAPSPTWVFSDAARRAGAQAMFYSSRSRPELTHVVVFDLDCLRFVGPLKPAFL